MFYSKSTKGFYDSEVHGSNMPKDVVEVSYEEWEKLLLAQNSGQQIVADKNGRPIAVDKVEPEIIPEELLAKYKREANKLMDKVAQSWDYTSIIDGISFLSSTNTVFKTEAELLNAWRDACWDKIYAMQIKNLPTTAEGFLALLPEAPTQPTKKSKGK